MFAQAIVERATLDFTNPAPFPRPSWDGFANVDWHLKQSIPIAFGQGNVWLEITDVVNSVNPNAKKLLQLIQPLRALFEHRLSNTGAEILLVERVEGNDVTV